METLYQSKLEDRHREIEKLPSSTTSELYLKLLKLIELNLDDITHLYIVHKSMW